MKQIIIKDYESLDAYFLSKGVTKIFLVCGKTLQKLDVCKYFQNLKARLKIEVIYFSDYVSNPEYESVIKGVELYQSRQCDGIVAVGGGSAIDVAKCIKLYSNMNTEKFLLTQQILPNEVPFCVMPTTAGTGSEATRFAVIYLDKEKQSICNDSCLPEAVYIDPSVLKILPNYQRKSTMLDALCHSIEAFWSVHSTVESHVYALDALKLIIKYMDLYLQNNSLGNEKMFIASNKAGKAINIAQTTAGHAMSYKLTTYYGISHGHAAALCVSALWPYMLNHLDDCVDIRGREYVKHMFEELTHIMGYKEPSDASKRFREIVEMMEFDKVREKSVCKCEELAEGVNIDRLQNNPIRLDKSIITQLYYEILCRQ